MAPVRLDDGGATVGTTSEGCDDLAGRCNRVPDNYRGTCLRVREFRNFQQDVSQVLYGRCRASLGQAPLNVGVHDAFHHEVTGVVDVHERHSHQAGDAGHVVPVAHVVISLDTELPRAQSLTCLVLRHTCFREGLQLPVHDEVQIQHGLVSLRVVHDDTVVAKVAGDAQQTGIGVDAHQCLRYLTGHVHLCVLRDLRESSHLQCQPHDSVCVHTCLRLVVEVAVADEFANDGRAGDDVDIHHRQEVIQEPDQPTCFGVLGHRVVDLQQQLHGIVLEEGQLVYERRVEHGVGVLLKGEDVPFLAHADRVPDLQGLQGRVPAEVVVTHHAPKDPYVGRRNAVVGVQVEEGEGRHVDTELVGIRYLRGQLGVQPMDTLDDEDGAVVGNDG